MITVLYPVHNRLEYTKMSLPRVIEECKNKLVKHFIIFDDNSEKDTVNYINSLNISSILGKKYIYKRQKVGNSTGALNYCIEHFNTKYLYKIDNDILIPKGAIDVMFTEIDRRKRVSFLMMRETAQKPYINRLEVKDASHIGGVGIFRMETLKKRGKINSSGRFFGFTLYQQQCIRDFRVKACVLTKCGNTNLDMSKWSKVKEYTKKGWSRDIRLDAKNTIYRKYK